MSNPVPSLVLFGPDKGGVIYTVDVHGNRRPLFASNVKKHSKPQLEMFRILQSGLYQPFGTGTLSSLSGSITLAVHGQEIKMKDSWEGMQYRKYFTGPAGEMTWKPTGWANGMELWDKGGLMLARYTYLKLTGDPRLEIFVPIQDFLLDIIVTAAVSILVDEKKGLKIVSDLVGTIVGS